MKKRKISCKIIPVFLSILMIINIALQFNENFIFSAIDGNDKTNSSSSEVGSPQDSEEDAEQKNQSK